MLGLLPAHCLEATPCSAQEYTMLCQGGLRWLPTCKVCELQSQSLSPAHLEFSPCSCVVLCKQYIYLGRTLALWGRILVLYVSDLGLISGIPYGPPSLPEIFPKQTNNTSGAGKAEILLGDVLQTALLLGISTFHSEKKPNSKSVPCLWENGSWNHGRCKNCLL